MDTGRFIGKLAIPANCKGHALPVALGNRSLVRCLDDEVLEWKVKAVRRQSKGGYARLRRAAIRRSGNAG